MGFKISIQKSIRKIDNLISKIYFSELKITPLYSVVSKPFYNTSVDHLPDLAAKSFNYYNGVEQIEYYYKLTGTYFIEPFNGWVFDASKKHYLINSTPYSFLNEIPSFYNIKIKTYEVVKIPKVISIRYNFQNYWHFLNDALGQIAMIDKFENDKDVPILVPNGVLQIPFVKAAINYSSQLKDRTWIEHKYHTIVKADCIIVAKNTPNTKLNFLSVLNKLGININNRHNRQLGKKIFITRKNTTFRILKNSEEIEKIVRQHGFEIIDNSNLSFKEQILLYESCETIIATHGAGLTNMIFRYPLKLTLIELFPKESIFPHYYWLSNQLGFNYSCIIGSKTDKNNEFYIEPQKLTSYLG